MTIREAILQHRFQFLDRTLIGEFVQAMAGTIPEGSVVIDAGAGEGMYKHLFAHTRYIALDRGIGDAVWDYSKLDVICDVHELPIKTGGIPFVLCTQTLEHISRPHVVVSELFRILSAGGKAFCTIPFLVDGHHQEPYDFFRYTKYAAEDIFTRAGFRQVEVQPIGGYNTLMVSLFQKGMFRFIERQQHRPKFVLYTWVLLQRIIFVFVRWVNRFAYWRDRKDPDRYKFAMGFTVTATK